MKQLYFAVVAKYWLCKVMKQAALTATYKYDNVQAIINIFLNDSTAVVFSLCMNEFKNKQKIIFVKAFIYSFSSLSYDRSKASSKASPPHSAIQSFRLQMRVSYPFLKVIQQLRTSSSLSSCHFYPPFYLSFNNPLQKAVSTQNVTNLVRLPFTYKACPSESGTDKFMQRFIQFKCTYIL